MRYILTTRASKVQIEKRDCDTLVATVTKAFRDTRHYRDAGRELGVDPAMLTQWVDAHRQSGGTETEQEVPDEPECEPFEVRIRGRLERGEAGRVVTGDSPVAALSAALAVTDYPVPEPLITWDGMDRLCAVDVDYHHRPYDTRPDSNRSLAFAATLTPRPCFAWSTHGRGLRLIYESEDLAGVAALVVLAWDPGASVELKSSTRHPGYPTPDGRRCGPVSAWTPNRDMGPIRAWLGQREADDGVVAEWREAKGYEIGHRYPHDRCPVAPEDGGGRDPVVVQDGGIYCHACAARGVMHGSRTVGWFPWVALCGTPIDTTVSVCLKHFTHWAHAKHVLAEVTGLGEGVARAVYRAALRVLHGDDPRIPAVFAAGEHLIRIRRSWATLTGEPITRQPERVIQVLPTCHRVTPEGKVVLDDARTLLLAQSNDLFSEGYPSLEPVWGVRVYGQFLPYQDPRRVSVVLQTPALAHPMLTHVQPTYVGESRRSMSEDDAWKVIEELLPKINRRFIKLLLAARGCQEGEKGLPPMVFVAGPTSAGKTAATHVAAAMLGDHVTEVSWSASHERLRQGIFKAKQAGSFCVFNEFLKEATNNEVACVGAMDFVLQITPSTVSHMLYVGQVPLGALPVCVWTDTTIPDAVKQSAQVARRIVGVELTGSVDWATSLTAHGVSQVLGLRVACPQFAAAANVIVSCVIDQFFRVPRTFEAIACELGYRTLANSDMGEEGREQLRDFFRLVASQKTHSDPFFKGRGWVEIPLYGESDLTCLWRTLADADGRGSRRCSEVDWSQLMRAQPGTEFNVRRNGSKLCVRFRAGENRNYRVNGECLLPCTATTTPVAEIPSEEMDWSWATSLPNGI